MYNKDESKWYNRNLEEINKGMGIKQLYSYELIYAEAQARAWKAKQENRKVINDREHFITALYENTSEVFKPLTQNQNDSLKQNRIFLKN